MQDDTRLLDIVPLKDGRDYVVLERLYKTQSVLDAHLEVDLFWGTLFQGFQSNMTLQIR